MSHFSAHSQHYTQTASALSARSQPTFSLAHLTLVLVGGYAAVNALSDRILQLDRLYFGSCVLILASTTVLITLLRGRVSSRVARFTALYLIGLSLIAFSIPFQEQIYPIWLAGDLAVVAAPGLLLLIAVFHPTLFSNSSVRKLLVVLAATALLGPVFRDVADLRRFRPPEPGLTAAVWVCVFAGRTKLIRTIGLLALPIVFGLAWFSMVRYSPIAFFAMGTLAAVVYRRYSRAAVVAGAAILTILAVHLARPAMISETIEESRFRELAGADLLAEGPVYIRLIEGLDIWQYVSQEANPYQVAFGFGFGATYRPRRYYLIPEGSAAGPLRITDEGLRHVIHFGPLRILFRYGLLGLLVLCSLFALIAKDLVAFTSRSLNPYRQTAVVLFALTLLVYLGRFFLQPVINDLVFAYFCAGYLFLRHRRPHSGPTETRSP